MWLFHRENFDNRGANTVCPRSIDPYYIVSYCIEWVTTN